MVWLPILFPAGVLPLLGAAYSRAREYTCDRYGLVCCQDSEDAIAGVAALAAGGRRWKTLNSLVYAGQSAASRGFWMSFHELIGDYPWLVKRVAALKALAANQAVKHPRRHLLAWVFALFVPRFGIRGGGGGLTSVIIVVAVIGILAAIAIPAYQDYSNRAAVVAGLQQMRAVERAVEGYAVENKAWPKSGADVGLTDTGNKFGPRIAAVELGENGVIFVRFRGPGLDGAGIALVPNVIEGQFEWRCAGLEIKQTLLPAQCRSAK